MTKVNQITIAYDDGNTVTATRNTDGSKGFSLEASDFAALHTMGPHAESRQGDPLDEKSLLWELSCALGITAEVVEPRPTSGGV